MNGYETKTAKLSDIKPSPIQHETLSNELLGKVLAIWKQIRGFAHVSTLEEFEVGFMHDANPEREVAVWEIIGRAFALYRQRSPDATGEKLKNACFCLVALSMGAKLDISKPELDRLNACFKEAR